jgi:dephospho-CoA kinase
VLRAILLENESNKNCIEVILHPKILKTMQEWQKNSQKPLNIVEIPLLIERNLAYLFDRVIILTCNEEKQLKRLKNRANIDEKQAKKMISMQTSLRIFSPKASTSSLRPSEPGVVTCLEISSSRTTSAPNSAKT